MNKRPFARHFSKPGSRKAELIILMLLATILLTAGILFAWPGSVIANTQLQANKSVEANPTPTPPVSNAERATRTSPVVGILVLLAPLVYLAWKSRGLKEPKITASCCLPVIDENKHPFRVEKDLPIAKKSSSD
jgi:hypothetical protein